MFLSELQKNNPSCLNSLGSLLREFIQGKINQKAVMGKIKLFVKNDITLVDKLNSCLIENEKLRLVGSEEKRKLCEFIIYKMYPSYPEDMVQLVTTSI